MTFTIHKTTFVIRLAALVAAFLFVGALPAQTPAWFPLEVGNTWLYRPAATNRVSPDQSRTISVHGVENIAGRDYFDVSYFGRELVLRVESSDGSIVLYDRASNAEQPWLSLGLPVGESFSTKIDPCSTTGTIAARDAAVSTPAGDFSDAVSVKFQGNCADAGLTQQFHVANIGLVSSEETTFAGPLKYELVYYHVGTRTSAGQEVSFTAAINSPAYPAGSTLQARLTLRSTSNYPLMLHFPSGQSFDLKIRDSKGNEVYRWSTGKAFTLIVRDETFGPGERTYGVSAPLTDLPLGNYTVEAYLTTNPVIYVSQVAFQIVGETEKGPGSAVLQQ
jgi:hypothetical protein